MCVVRTSEGIVECINLGGPGVLAKDEFVEKLRRFLLVYKKVGGRDEGRRFSSSSYMDSFRQLTQQR